MDEYYIVNKRTIHSRWCVNCFALGWRLIPASNPQRHYIVQIIELKFQWGYLFAPIHNCCTPAVNNLNIQQPVVASNPDPLEDLEFVDTSLSPHG